MIQESTRASRISIENGPARGQGRAPSDHVLRVRAGELSEAMTKLLDGEPILNGQGQALTQVLARAMPGLVRGQESPLDEREHAVLDRSGQVDWVLFLSQPSKMTRS